MRLQDLMACDQSPLRPDQTIRDAAQRLDEGRCTALPVCDDERLVGVLTNQDVTRAVAGHANPGAVAVEEVMTRDPSAASPDANLLEASELEVRWNDLADGLPIPTASLCGRPEL